MKRLKSYKLFESSNKMTTKEFCERYLPGSFGTSRYKIVNDEIVMDGDVYLYNKGLSYIPKFASINGYIDVRRNNLKTFEFLPEECNDYLICQNPYEGELKRIMDLVLKRDEVVNIYKKIFNDFIKICLQYEVWHDGQSNEFAIKEAWNEAKLKSYRENKDALFYGKSELLDLDDTEILKDKFDLDLNGDWVLELVEKLINNMKSVDEDHRRFNFKLLFTIIKSDEDDRIKEVIENEYDLSEIYSRLDSIPNLSEKSLDKLILLLNKKLIRNETQRQRDDENDLFVFIARDKFIEKKDGNFKKSIEIENLIKIDLYNPDDLNQVNLMKIRARMQSGGSEVYMIWIPKGFFREEKDSYRQEEIPEWIFDLINQKKTRI